MQDAIQKLRIEALLKQHDANTPEVWDAIARNNGSVQHLTFLSTVERACYKTPAEIDPLLAIKVIETKDIDRQMMAMRYLLLGLMQDSPEYKVALQVLEEAAPYVAALSKVPARDTDLFAYKARLLSAFKLYPELSRINCQAKRLSQLLKPQFDEESVVLPVAEAEGIDSIAGLAAPLAPVTGQFEKLFDSMQFFLLGAMKHDNSYRIAYEALQVASAIHVGVRKDGKTPEFQHQLEIAHLVRTMLRNLIHPAETLAAIFLHDTPEDYDVPYAEINWLFGVLVANATRLLNKYDEQGNPKPLDEYYAALAYDPIASVAKPADNGHNQSTMASVFSYKKQFEYSLNIKNRSWNMMKVARRLWPEQESVYENLKFLLRIQYNAVQAMLNAVQFDPETGEIHPALRP
jgi:hypothetical protein